MQKEEKLNQMTHQMRVTRVSELEMIDPIILMRSTNEKVSREKRRTHPIR